MASRNPRWRKSKTSLSSRESLRHEEVDPIVGKAHVDKGCIHLETSYPDIADVGKIPAEEIYAQAEKAFVEKKT